MKTLLLILRTLLIGIFSLGPLLVLSCGDDPSKPPPVDATGYPAATTIEQWLENFQRAHNDMAYLEYETLLDDDYKFFFDPNDISEDTGFRDHLPRPHDLGSTERMFHREKNSANGRRSRSIRMDYVAEEPVVSDVNSDWKKVLLRDFVLEVETVMGGYMDPADSVRAVMDTIWVREGHQADLHMLQTEGDPSVWKLVMVSDRRPHPKGGSGTSWGKIKAWWQ